MPGTYHINTIIIGGGAAGLACAACLSRTGISYLLLEMNTGVGNQWTKRYDRLHLHTPRNNSSLPYLRMPTPYPTYVSKDDVARYLQQYASAFGVNALFSQKVLKAAREEEGWQVTTEMETFSSDNLIIATGLAGRPRPGVWKGLEAFEGQHIHSAEYINGKPFSGKRVLVVGFGNSACEIVLCLHEHNAIPAMSVRGCINILPRDLVGIPILDIARFENWLTRISPQLADAVNKPVLRLAIGSSKKYGLKQCSYGPLTQITRKKRIPLLDIGTLALLRRGHIRVYPDIAEVGRHHVRFIDGREEDFDIIISATGYEPSYADFLVDAERVSDASGLPIVSGKETALPGLFFCGFNVSATGMLREIGIEARKIAERLKAGA